MDQYNYGQNTNNPGGYDPDILREQQKEFNKAIVDVEKARSLAGIQMDIENLKHQNAKSLIERKEELLREREFFDYDVVFDGECRICKVLIDADGEPRRIKPACKMRGITVEHYIGIDKTQKEELLIVFGEGKLLFGLSEISSKELEKGFLNAGCPLQTHRDYKKNLSEKVLGLLIDSAHKNFIPLLHGWNRIGNQWYWGSEEDSLVGMKKRLKEI